MISFFFQICLFLVVFASLWILVCGILSFGSGWNKLSRTNPYGYKKETFLHQAPYSSLHLNLLGSYPYSISISINHEGILLSPSLLFYPFHKPVFLYFYEIKSMNDYKEFLSPASLDVYLNEHKLRFSGKIATTIKNIYESGNYYRMGE